jgi:hypothetical protein
MNQLSHFDTLKAIAEQGGMLSLQYDSPETIALMTTHEDGSDVDWDQYYPEVDGAGMLTGRLIDYDADGFIVVDDMVMVEAASLSRDELAMVNAGRFPVWPDIFGDI